MIRYGSVAKLMRPMASDDLLISRLKLLLIMAKAFLKGYPMGDLRKSAIAQNAQHFSDEALVCAASAKAPPTDKPRLFNPGTQPHEHQFVQRVQLLVVMLNAFVEGSAKGIHRKKALAQNIDHLSEVMADHLQVSEA